jgi:hypothetical protein
MTLRRRIPRLLLIVGLIPAVAAAGLPLPACACGFAEPVKACCCGTKSPCDKCLCKAAERSSDRSRLRPGQSMPGGAGAVRGCPCVSQPAPVAPTSPATSTVTIGLPAKAPAAVALPSAVPPSAERLRSALLPAPDLPTTLCALVI